MNMVILDGYNFIVSHNKWRNNIVIITSEIRNEHESEKCSFMFLFLMFMRWSWFIKMKSRTKRYKDIKIKIVKSFQIHIFILEPVQPTSTVQNIFCHEIGLSVRGCFETSILFLIHRYNSLRFSAFRMHFWSTKNRLRLLSFEKKATSWQKWKVFVFENLSLGQGCWRQILLATSLRFRLGNKR